MILLAQPGAGKTTVLQRIALDRAVACLQDAAGGAAAAVCAPGGPGGGGIPAHLPRAYVARTRAGQRGRRRPSCATALRQGRLCLLVDAINEARRENYSERMLDWRDFAGELPAGNQLVFSCRTLDYNGELAVQQVEIDPLTPAQIEEFAGALPGRGAGAGVLAGAAGRATPSCWSWRRRPTTCTCWSKCLTPKAICRPTAAQLFAQFVFQLFDRERRKRHAVAWIDPAAQHLALGELAFAIQAVGEGTQVDEAWAASKLPAQVTLPPHGRSVATPPDDVLALARAATFLAGDGKVKFTHHLLQEYFAAEALLRRLAAGQDLAELWRVPSGADEMPPAQRGEWDPLPGPPTQRLGGDDDPGGRALPGGVRRRAAGQPGAGGALPAGKRGRRRCRSARGAARPTCWRGWAMPRSTCAAAARRGCCWAGWATRALWTRKSAASG